MRFQCSRCLKIYTMDEFAELDVKDHTRYCKCGRGFHKDRWKLRTKQDNYEISTVHTETSQFDNAGKDREMWYETMIFDKKKSVWLDFQARYVDGGDAQKGHELACKMLPKIISNPEKHPMDELAHMLGKIGNAQERGGHTAENKMEVQDDIT